MTDEQTQTQPLSDDPQQEPVTEPVAEPVAEPVIETVTAEPATDQKPEAPYKSKLVNFDELRAGQTVKLYERIKDVSPKGEERERLQVFEGIILGVKGAGISRTLTIHKVSEGVGVEKIYPVNSPVVAKIELVKTAKVRRAKLTFIKNLKKRFKRALKETYVG